EQVHKDELREGMRRSVWLLSAVVAVAGACLAAPALAGAATFSNPGAITLLVAPGGAAKTILMADSGGKNPGVSGVNLTFDHAAAAQIPDSSAPVSGSYQPAIGTTSNGDGCRFPASFPAPAPAGPYGSPSMSVFNGTDPNGMWSLYVVDDSAMFSGAISGSWSLDITA